METYREVEQSFEIDDGFTVSMLVPPLGELGAALEDAGRVHLRAIYYDTEDLRLLGAGITLRRREGGKDDGWHLKVPQSGPKDRLELRLPLDTSAEAVPAELAELLTAQVRGGELRPVLTIETDRQLSLVRVAGGEPALELDDDRVTASRLADGEIRSWRELEVERLADDALLARAVGRLLRHAGARPSPAASKAARALTEDRATSLAIDNKDLLARRLRDQLVEIARQDMCFRRGGSEAVHDLRVAVRRLRSCLKTFGELLEPAPLEELGNELAWLGDVLGEARDREVIAGRTRRGLDALEPQERLGPVRAELSGKLEASAASAREALLEALREPRYAQLLDRLAAFAAAPPYRRGCSGRDTKTMRRLALKEVKRTERRVRRAESTAGEAQEANFHAARRVAKRVRYAAETLAPLSPKAARKMASRFEDVQEVLGDRHDAAIARRLYAEEGARAGVRPGQNGFTYGLLAEREHQAIAEAASRFRGVWRRAAKRSLRRFLT